MRLYRWLPLALLVSACSGGIPGSREESNPAVLPEVSKDGIALSDQTGGKARVIVADIDSGINVYHAFYYAGGPQYLDKAPSAVTPEVLAELGIGADHILTLTRTGDFAADYAADKAIWDNFKTGELYWIKGTNIIGLSFQPREEEGLPGEAPIVHLPLIPDDEDDTHGTGTAASVIKGNPEAIVLFIEADYLGSPNTHGFAFKHPSVDIVTTSYGFSIPNTGFPMVEAGTFLDTFEGVVKNGKLHFSSGGNGSGLTPFRAGAGPWWSIGVSGFEEDTSNGDTQVFSGNFPDFTADYTQELPYCMACEDGYEEFVGGTSFSTPISAGIASRVILEARRATGHTGGIKGLAMVDSKGTTITNWQVRRALEEAAYIPTASEYDPVEAVFDLGATPINPVAPWLQIGWGVLTPNPDKGVITETLSQLGFGPAPERVKGLGFCDFQTAIIDARHVYWDNVSPFGALVTPLEYGQGGEYGDDPFIYCE